MNTLKFLERLVNKNYNDVNEIWIKEEKVVLIGDNTFYEGFFDKNKLFIHKRALKPCVENYKLVSMSF